MWYNLIVKIHNFDYLLCKYFFRGQLWKKLAKKNYQNL